MASSQRVDSAKTRLAALLFSDECIAMLCLAVSKLDPGFMTILPLYKTVG